MSYTFNDRASYFEAHAQWKADYAQISIDIRAAKLAFRQAESAWSKDSKPASGNWIAVSKTRNVKDELRKGARSLLAERAKMKKEAQKQYLAEKQTVN